VGKDQERCFPAGSLEQVEKRLWGIDVQPELMELAFWEASRFLGSSLPREAALAVLLSADALPSQPGPAQVSCPRRVAPRKVQVMARSHNRVGKEIEQVSADT